MPQRTRKSQSNLAHLEQVEILLSQYLHKNNSTLHWSNLVIPILSAVIAIAGILSGLYIQEISTRAQVQEKNAEIILNVKRQGYAELMAGLDDAYFKSQKGYEDEFRRSIEKLPVLFYSIAPFIPTIPMQDQLWRKLYDIITLLNHTYDVRSRGADSGSINGLGWNYFELRDQFSEKLNYELFPEVIP